MEGTMKRSGRDELWEGSRNKSVSFWVDPNWRIFVTLSHIRLSGTPITSVMEHRL
jgi:hypothetical protein